MVGILDYIDGSSATPSGSLFGILNNASAGNGVFPDVPKTDEQKRKDVLDGIVEQQLKNDAMSAGPAPPFPAPDQTNPAVQMATGNAPLAFGPPTSGPFGALAPPSAASQPTQTPANAPVPVPIPRPRPVASPLAPAVANAKAAAPIDDTTTPRPAPTPQGSTPQANVPEPSLASQFKDALAKVGQNIDSHQSTLLAMAGGLAGAPSLGAGLGRAFTAAAAAIPQDQKMAMLNGSVAASTAAFKKAGVPQEQIIAAQYDPDLRKSLYQNYVFDRKSTIEHVKDGLGNERLVAVNPYDNTSKDITGGGPSGGNTASPSTAEPSYDPVTKRDEAFLGSLDPTTAAAVKDIADGNMSGTGRNLQKLMPYVARYEQGFSNGTYTARNKFNTEFGSQSASTVGGQKVLMGTALGHLGEAAEAAANLNNTNGLGSADAGYYANAVKNRTTTNAALANGLNDKVAKFSGEVGKLYSGSSGGGVHEREESRGRLGSNLTSAELAAGLESNRDLILSKQQALQQHAVDLFGEEGAKKFDFIGPEGRKSLDKIENAIARLKGMASPAQAATAAPATPPPPGNYTYDPATRRVVPAQ